MESEGQNSGDGVGMGKEFVGLGWGWGQEQWGRMGMGSSLLRNCSLTHSELRSSSVIENLPVRGTSNGMTRHLQSVIISLSTSFALS